MSDLCERCGLPIDWRNYRIIGVDRVTCAGEATCIERLRAALAESQATLDRVITRDDQTNYRQAVRLQRELEKRTNELDAARADARRYHHLRKRAKITSAKMNSQHYWTIAATCWPGLRGPSIDAAIDEAMRVEEEERKQCEP